MPGSWPQPPPGLPFPIVVGRRGAAGLREDIRCEREDDQGPDGLHSTALEAAGMGGPVPGSISGCEMWAGHSAFLSCSMGSLRLHWGNNEPSIGMHVKALKQCLQRDKSLMKVKVSVTQLCPTLCDWMDFSSPGSSVCGILQARILE